MENLKNKYISLYEGIDKLPPTYEDRIMNARSRAIEWLCKMNKSKS